MTENKIVIQLVTTEEDLYKVLDNILESKLARFKASEPEIENIKAVEELLTIKQLAEFFQVSETSIHAWKNEGILPYVKVRSRIRFKKSEVLKLYEKRKKSFQ